MLDIIYTDVRAWLISLGMLPEQVISAYNNLAPIPNDGVIMTILFDSNLDQTSTEYTKDQAHINNSVKVTMQIDCYGEQSYDRARKIATLWFSMPTCDFLQNTVPLTTAITPKDLSFTNETGQYELRFMTTLELQYNTNYEQSIETLTTIPNVDIIGI